MRLFLPLFLSLTLSAVTFAYTYNKGLNGVPVKWLPGQKLFLAGNPSGNQVPSPLFFKEHVIHALQQWEWATNGYFSFDYWQGEDPKVYEQNLNQNGLNSIFFASRSRHSIDRNVIGYTQVWYNNSTGEILEADVILNDIHYQLTAKVTDTSSSFTSGTPKVYLPNLITHELGHALGLSHSDHFNSSMLYVEYLDQNKIACDDWAGARSLYTPNLGVTGSLTGVVNLPNGAPASGVVVSAISESRGIVIATQITDRNGEYSFQHLESGRYHLMYQAYSGPTQSIPIENTPSDLKFCSNNRFPNQFDTSPNDPNELHSFDVNTQILTRVNPYTLHCDPVTSSGNRYSAALAPNALVDIAQLGVGREYRFASSGEFTVTAPATTLNSTVKINLSAFNESGQALSTTKEENLYSSESGFKIPESRLRGNYFGIVTVRAVPSSNGIYSYSAIGTPNMTPYYTIQFSNQKASLPNSILPDNGRCSPEGNFPPYVSPEGDPIRYATTRSSRDNISFCGNANALGNTHPPRRASTEGLVGWCIPFFFIFSLKSRRVRAILKLE